LCSEPNTCNDNTMINRLSIIIPAYNEAKLIEKNLRELTQVFPDAELIVINEGSTDETATNIKIFDSQIMLIDNCLNTGKGFAIRQGMLMASGDYFIFTDADLPFGTEGIKKIQTALVDGNVDVVIAEKVEYKRGIIYLSARKIIRIMIFLLFRFPFQDTQAGLKGFTRQAAVDIFKNSIINGYAIDIEILWIAKKKQFRVESLNFIARRNELRRSHFNAKSGLSLVFDIIKIRLKNYR
jgi:dolichyl-phosphate beta-glucosyltransferase